MAKFEVEVEGKISESVWGFYEIEAESEKDAEEQARELFDEDNYGTFVLGTYTTPVEDED